MQSIANKIAAPFRNGIVFVIVYLLFLLPTYYLPYVGSNSSVINALGAAVGAGLSPQFWAHVAALFVLVVATWLRGCAVGKQWIVIFPVIASVFDMTPGLSLIPLVPTAMHLVALIMGARGETSSVPEVRVPIAGAIAMCAIGAVIVSGLTFSWAWKTRVDQPQTATSPNSAGPKINPPTLTAATPNPTKAVSSDSLKLVGRWRDLGPSCALILNGRSEQEIQYLAWYCEAGEGTAKPIFLRASQDGKFVDPQSGLTISLQPNGEIAVLATKSAVEKLGDGTYIANTITRMSRE